MYIKIEDLVDLLKELWIIVFVYILRNFQKGYKYTKNSKIDRS